MPAAGNGYGHTVAALGAAKIVGVLSGIDV
jgi:hypothetical protein